MTVGANSGSKTIYSADVGIGGMLQLDTVDEGDSGTASLEEAGLAYSEEMRWRGESLGPLGVPGKREEAWSREPACDRACGRRSEGVPEVPVEAEGYHEGRAPSFVTTEREKLAGRTPIGTYGVESHGVFVAGDADEHCIDDCYA